MGQNDSPGFSFHASYISSIFFFSFSGYVLSYVVLTLVVVVVW